MTTLNDFKKISDVLWEISKNYRYDMRVPARVYATQSMIEAILEEHSIDQLINTATLPGVTDYALAMPDIHQGYGFPIGGVVAIDTQHGIISPGGVGYDINCGVRLLTSPLPYTEVAPHLPTLINQVQRDVPSGVGRSSLIALSSKEMDQVLTQGAQWLLKKGAASTEDIEKTEENGCYANAQASEVSSLAKQRGTDQLGTLGAGNHFIEAQTVIKIFDTALAQTFGLFSGQLAWMIHTGSRGLGHQVCTDYVRLMNQNRVKWNIVLPDRELACAPFHSEEGQRYFGAMAAAANFAWTNRQMITDKIRKAWNKVMKSNEAELQLVYDVAHNIAKLERYHGKELLVHRKGATRAFGVHHPALPAIYQKTGQPVIIPGSMGTYSYVLVGTPEAQEKTFGSCCHGAGRRWSRAKAKRETSYAALKKRLESYGVLVRAGSTSGLVEETPDAYKDIDSVVSVVCQAGIAKLVAKLKPVAVIKG